MAGRWAIECEDLRRVYRERGLLGAVRETVAVDGVTLQVPGGIVFGLLGPNGAGKTTTVRVLATLLAPTSGVARVLGFDVVREAAQVRRRIGLILGGDRGLYWRLSGRENLLYFGALNGMGPREAGRRADALLELVGLSSRANAKVEQYSRGMKQRLHIARGLLTDPEVIFMDEPTIGLDPLAAQELRQLIPALAQQGKTVLLTTHYMFEADSLCENIALINRGRIVAIGSPGEIKRRFSGITVIEVLVKQTRSGLLENLAEIQGVQGVDATVDGAFQRVVVRASPGSELRARVAEVIGPDSIETLVARDPTLEEAYINILR